MRDIRKRMIALDSGITYSPRMSEEVRSYGLDVSLGC